MIASYVSQTVIMAFFLNIFFNLMVLSLSCGMWDLVP